MRSISPREEKEFSFPDMFPNETVCNLKEDGWLEEAVGVRQSSMFKDGN